jgi:glycosyltransferase involved in cell wall biosynthesis
MAMTVSTNASPTLAGPRSEVSFSVVVGVRNAAPVLQRCLDSVFAQTHPNVEVVVIDGASTDGTVQVIERNAGGIAFWLSEPDRGVYSAWNKALDRATGEWLLFLGADDQLAGRDVLAHMAPHLAAAAGICRVVYGTVDVVDADDRVMRTTGSPWPEIQGAFRERMAIAHQGTFHHRDLFRARGPFDERFRIAGDYELLLREVLERPPLFVPGVTVVRMGAGGLSDRQSTRATILRERYRARRMHHLTEVPEWRHLPLQRSLIHAWLLNRFGLAIADLMGDAYRILSGGRRRGAG